MKLCLSNTFYGAYELVASELKKRRDGKSEHIIIVPDEFTLSVERGILTTLRVFAAFDIEVMSFSRLAAKTLKDAGIKYLTPEGAVMLISKVIAENRAELKYFKNSSKRSGFAKDIFAAVSELRNSGISSREVRQAAGQMMGSGANKLSDLALIYEKYISALSGRHGDSSSRLEAFAEYLSAPEKTLFDKHVYICDFYQFTAPQLEIIEKLMLKAKSLTVGLASLASGGNKRLYPHHTVQKVLARAEKAGVHVERVSEIQPLDSVSARLANGMYAFDGGEEIDAKGRMHLFKAGGCTAEIEEVARRIKTLVVEKGFRYKDIAVVSGGLDAYASTIKSVFKRFEIPYFMDTPERLLEQLPIRYIISAISAVESGFSRDEVLDFAKNPYFADEIFDFENYVLKYNENFSGFLKPFERGGEEAGKPEVIRAKMTETLAPICENASGLLSCASRLESIRLFLETSDFTQKSEELFKKIESDSLYYADCFLQSIKKMNAVFDEMQVVYGDAVLSFSEFKELLSNVLASAKISLAPLFVDTVFVGELGESRYADLKALFLIGAAQGVIPKERAGGVIIGEAEEAVFHRINRPLVSSVKSSSKLDVYFIIQLLLKAKEYISVSFSEVSEGDAVRPSSIFGELSALFLEKGEPLGIKVVSPPKSYPSSNPEFEKFEPKSITESSNFSNPNSKLNNENHKSSNGSNGNNDTENENLDKKGENAVTCAPGKNDVRTKENALEFARFLSTRKNAFYELEKSLSEVIEGRADAYRAAYHALGEEDKKRLDDGIKNDLPTAGEIEINGSLSASRMETYFKCPFQHFLRYVMRFEKRKEGKIEATDAGLIIHETLEKYFKHMLAKGNNFDIEEGEVESIVSSIVDRIYAEKYFVQMQNIFDKSMLLRIKNECIKTAIELTALQRETLFKPWKIEAVIGGDIKKLEIGSGRERLVFEGKIDRIDRYNEYILMIDYKTSASAELGISYIKAGLKIQLYVYLDAVMKEAPGLKPAGVVYLPIYDKFDKDEKSDLRYVFSGQIQAPPEVLNAIDGNYPTEQTEQSGRQKDEAGLKHTKRLPSKLLEETDFLQIVDYVERLILNAADEIRQGNILPSPIETGKSLTCVYCDYRLVCPKAGNADFRRKPKNISFVKPGFEVATEVTGEDERQHKKTSKN